jgi:serine/threonine protein kinase
MDNLIGKNLGRYHIIEPLGEGGMATVYKAFDTSLERNVAIKIIRGDKKEGTEQNEFLKRFQREARALAQLDHPYILKVLDYGEQDGTPYLVMPFVQGGTLREKMGQPMPYRQAAALLAPVAQALDYAHHRNIIHRDVKPANILISESGAPLLSDFGIAKIIESGESTQLTATGVGIGTPDYMAPEQWLGKADASTDIYSLGIVFFQMITGRLPFTAETPAAVLIKHMQDPLPRPGSFIPDLPEAVEQVLFKSLAKEPSNRFPDMGAFAAALSKLSVGDLSGFSSVPPVMQTVVSNTPGPTVQNMPKPSVRVQPPTAYTPSRVYTPSPLPPQAAPAPKKKFPGWVIALIIVVVIGAVALFAVLAGGAYLASQLARPKPTTTQAFLETSAFPTSIPISTDSFPTQSGFSVTQPFQSIDGLPADIPLLTDNNGDLTTTTSQGMTMYYFSTNMAFQDVVDFYKAGMDSNGWQLGNTTSQSGMQYWEFTKGSSRQVMISLSNDANQPVLVTIILQDSGTGASDQEPIPGLAGQWLDPDTSGTYTVIVWQNGEYVATETVNPGRGGNEVTDSYWDGSTLTWTYCVPNGACVTTQTISVDGDNLDTYWSSDNGRFGNTTMTRMIP